MPTRGLSGRPLVVVPTGRCTGWSASPNVGERPISVSPSLTGWAIANRRTGGDRATLIAGPELRESEVESLALPAPAETLVGDRASAAPSGPCRCRPPRVPRVVPRRQPALLDAHAGGRPAHRLRPRSLPTAPEDARAVGVQRRRRRDAAGGALLGLASALMSFGASSVVAPLTPVSDLAVVPVMDRLHRRRRRHDAATALATARTTSDELDPTAAAFVVIGA